MPVPEFNEIKAPALQFFADGQQHKISEVYVELAKRFALSDVDLSELLPSGTQSRWDNRANWACYDLYRAGLLDKPKRGLYVITALGKKIAEQKLPKIDREFLMQFPEFAKWIEATESKNQPGKKQNEVSLKVEAPPNEVMDAAYNSLLATLKAELLESIHKINPYRFERLVLDLLLAMGYGGSRDEPPHLQKNRTTKELTV